MTTQQATLAEWRAAVDTRLALSPGLESLPDRVSEAVEVLDARGRDLHRQLEAALEAERESMKKERAAYLTALETTVSNLVRPLMEEWSPTPAALAELRGAVEVTPELVASAVGGNIEAAANDLATRVEQRQQELAKLEHDALASRLEQALNEQRAKASDLERSVKGAIEAGVVAQRDIAGRVDKAVKAAVDELAGDLRSRISTIEQNLTASFKAAVTETVGARLDELAQMMATRLEELPEILVDSLGYAVETHSREVIARLEQIAAENRQALAEVSELAARHSQELAQERATQAATELERLVSRMAKRVAATDRPEPVKPAARKAKVPTRDRKG